MKRYYLSCLFALAAMPVFAQIVDVQKSSSWTSSAATTCTVPLTSAPALHHLIVVWTYWRTSTQNNLTVSQITDSESNTFPTAVGPTLQSASKTAAQTSYAISQGGSGSYSVTVHYSGAGPDVSSGCVAVEYSGADPNYPLDSASAGYSYSAGSLFDSGTAAPANANLLVFGGGTTDTGGANAGSGFMQVQRSTDGLVPQVRVRSLDANLGSGTMVMAHPLFLFPDPPPSMLIRFRRSQFPAVRSDESCSTSTLPAL